MTSVVNVVWEFRYAYLTGLLVTLKLCTVAWLGVLFGGGLIALTAEWWPRLVGWPAVFLSRMTEAILILVLLFWLHYPTKAALGVVINPFYTTAFLLAALNALAVFGMLRHAIAAV